MSIKDRLVSLKQRIESGVESKFPQQMPTSSEIEGTSRWGKKVLMVGGIVALLWAAFAPLGQGVPAHGIIKVEGERKAVQHPRGGVVDAILVREGDKVEAGQPLIRLNESQAQAQHGIVDSQLISLLATEARLNTERMNKEKIVFPEFLLARKENPQVAEVIQVQQHLFKTRQAALQGEIAIARENISGLEEQVKGLEAQEKAKSEQLRLFKEELASLKPLYEQGFVPRNRLFEVERAVAYMGGQRSEDIANMGRAKSQIGELKLKILQVKEVYRKEVETQLTDVQRQVADYKERRIATQDDLERVVLKAPVAGTVVDLTAHTVGGVVQAGQKLMDIVPASQSLVVEARIPPHLIDGVRVGQDADVHFLALDQTVVPTVNGKLTYISADSITDPRTEQSYFVGRVTPSPESMEKLGKQTIQAGMPADVVIKTGERSLLGYMLKPLLSRLQFAFTER